MVLYGVLGSVYFRFVVRFNIVCGALPCWYAWLGACCGATAVAVKDCVQEEGKYRLSPSSTRIAGLCA